MIYIHSSLNSEKFQLPGFYKSFIFNLENQNFHLEGIDDHVLLIDFKDRALLTQSLVTSFTFIEEEYWNRRILKYPLVLVLFKKS